MEEEGNFKIEQFNGKNYQCWKTQIEDDFYQKNIFLPLGEIAKKLASMAREVWEVLDRKTLGTIQLCLAASVAFNVTDQRTTKDLMNTLNTLYEKLSAYNNVFSHEGGSHSQPKLSIS